MILSARCVSWRPCLRPAFTLKFNPQHVAAIEFIANYRVTCNSETLMTAFAILGLIAFFGISLIPIYILRRREYARAREYFVASEPTPGGVVQNSSIAYSLQIAAFAQFFSWGARGDFWLAIVCAATFGAGLYLVYRLRRPILGFLSQALDRDRSVTVPGFIARHHGNDPRVRLFAAALSVLAFAGLITGAAIGVASLVNQVVPGGLNLTSAIASGLLGLTMLYTIPAGNSGAMRSAQAQLGILYLGLIGSILVVLYMLISSAVRMPPRGTFAVAVLAVCCAIVLIYRRSRYIDTSPIGRPVSGEAVDTEPRGARLFRRFSRVANELIALVVAITLGVAVIDLYAQGFENVITESVAALRAVTPASISVLMALVLLTIFYPIVDTTNWLRIAALPTDGGQTPEAFAGVLGMYAGASALLWLLICMFGTIAVLAAGMPDGADILQSFIGWLASQQNGVADAASGLLLVSLIALAVVTMSAMFSATLATIRYDLIPAVSPSLAQPSDQALARRRAVTAGGGVCVAVLIILSLLNDYLEPSFAGARFVNLQLACLCAQLAFVPLVVGPMILGTAGATSPVWAIAVLGAGVVAGQGLVIFSLQPEYKTWLWAAIPACLGVGWLLYAVALLRTRKRSPAA
jgi:hypothetical protein